MSGRTFYMVAAAFAGGIFLRSLFYIPIGIVLLLTLTSLALFLIAAHVRGRQVVYAVMLVAFSLGIIRTDIGVWDDIQPELEYLVEEVVVIEGVIIREPDERARTTQLTVNVEKINEREASGRVLVLTERFPSYQYGDRIEAKGTLEKPESFGTDLGRTFNYPGYLSVRGISYTLPFADVKRIGEGEGVAMFSALLLLKRAFMDSVEQLLPEPQAGLAEGLVLGVKRALGEDLETAFRRTGIIHIVVLSGYNVTIVAEAIMRLLSGLLMPRMRTLIGAIAIAAFAFIAGFSATVVRASLMAGLVLVARATGNTYAVMRGLVLTGLAMLLINPKLLVFDPGFQLSFLATMGLILLAPLIMERFSLMPTKFQIREFVTATISTQIFVLPLLLYSIGEFSLVAVPVNVLVLPVVPFAMLFIFISGMIGLVSSLIGLPFAFAAHVLLTYIVYVVEFFDSFEYASFPIPFFPFWAVLVAYAVTGLFLYGQHRKIVAQKRNA